MAAVLLAVAASGCATMQDNSPRTSQTQDITLNLTPATAQCQAFQAATPTGSFDPARKILTVPKSHDALEILCSAPGFKDKRVVLIPDTTAALGSASFILADFGPVDYFYSAYPQQVSINMDPLEAPVAPR